MSNTDAPLPILKLSDQDLEGYVPFSNVSGPKRALLPFNGRVAVRPIAVVPGRAKPAQGQTVGNAKLHFDLEVLDEDAKGVVLVKDQPVEGRQKNDNKPNALGLVDALISSGLPQETAIGLVKEGHPLPEIAGLFLRGDAVLYVQVSENTFTPTEGKNAGKVYFNTQVDRWISKTDYEAAVAAKQHRQPLSPAARSYYEATQGGTVEPAAPQPGTQQQPQPQGANGPARSSLASALDALRGQRT